MGKSIARIRAWRFKILLILKDCKRGIPSLRPLAVNLQKG